MDQALHMHMVPTVDVDRLRQFYVDGLGWSEWGPSLPGVLLIRLGTATMIFLDRNHLVAESGLDLAERPRAINAVFVKDKGDVDAQMARAVAAGATITSPVQDRDRGLLSGYFADPEGNGWEIVWSPVMRPGADGGLDLALPQT